MKDTVRYAALGENLYKTGQYQINENSKIYKNNVHTKYPPAYPIMIALTMPFTQNAAISAKIVSIFFSGLLIGLCFLFLRTFSLKRNIAILLSLLVLFNPWFFYFTAIKGLSEGAGSFFLILSLYFMYLYFEQRHKRIYLVLGALLLGFSCMIRLVFLASVAVFSVYFLICLIRKQQIKDSILFITLSTLPLALWLVRNFMNRGNYSVYTKYFSNSIISYPHTLLYFILIVFPFSFLFISYFIFPTIREIFRKNNIFWKLILISFIFHIMVSVLAWDLVYHVGAIKNPWSFNEFYINYNWLFRTTFGATRYIVPFVPVFMMMIGWALFREKEQSKAVVFSLSSLVLVFAVMTILYSNGYLQNRLGKKINLTETYVQRSDAGVQLVSYLKNINHEKCSLKLRFLNQQFKEVIGNLLHQNGLLAKVDAKNTSMKQNLFVISDQRCSSVKNWPKGECDMVRCSFETKGMTGLSIYECR